jgi:hypothetical protein
MVTREQKVRLLLRDISRSIRGDFEAYDIRFKFARLRLYIRYTDIDDWQHMVRLQTLFRRRINAALPS